MVIQKAAEVVATVVDVVAGVADVVAVAAEAVELLKLAKMETGLVQCPAVGMSILPVEWNAIGARRQGLPKQYQRAWVAAAAAVAEIEVVMEEVMAAATAAGTAAEIGIGIEGIGTETAGGREVVVAAEIAVNSPYVLQWLRATSIGGITYSQATV